MARIYTRSGSDILYFDFVDADGERQQQSSQDKRKGFAGYRIGQEAEAEKALALILRTVAAERELRTAAVAAGALPADTKVITIEMYWNHRLRKRLADPETEGAAKANIWHGRDYIIPLVGHYLLVKFWPEHAAEFVASLKAHRLPDGTPLATSTLRTIWSALKGMFKSAVIARLVASNPCVLERKVLPKRKDKNPQWRRTAVFSLEEVEALISDERIPLQRRVLYAILFIAGLRPGEASALRWSYYETSWKPLALLDIQVAFDTDNKKEGDTKTGKQRLIPVHPTLAKMLAQWRLSGWAEFMGRAPKPDDLIVPTQQGKNQSGNGMRNRALEDVEMLGWRKRRFYDSRRTFVSRCQADLIPKDIYRWWTHGPEEEVVDLYASVDWPAHCREMLKLKVELREGKLLQMAASARPPHGGGWDSGWDSRRQPPKLTTEKGIGARGFEPPPRLPHTQARSDNAAQPLGTDPHGWSTVGHGSEGTVPLSHSRVSATLRGAADEFESSHDAARLRRQLTDLLAALGDAE